MNRILVSENGIEGINVVNNHIELNDGEYSLEYLDSGNYEISFIINGNVKLIESSFDKEIDINNKYIINGGYLNIIKFYNNINVKETIDIDLCKDGSKVDYCFSNICRGVEKYIININHKFKNTISNINNKSVALLNSKIDYVINSNVGKDCVKSVLDQSTRIVTMGECDTSISPNMFIDLDDVEAKHGSVIGTFKDDQLFYLMSKGINYNDSIKLLIKGYLLDKLAIDVDLRFKIIDIIDTYWR
jgi:hypothetical protein